MVWDNQPEGAIHLFDGSHLSVIYGEKDCSKFSEAWMPLAYTVAIIGSSFNWGEIISKQLSICVQQAQTSKEGEAPTFYMASYLLDVMCARNVFAGMNLRWHVAELPIHVYFNMLWENRYKKSYSLICDEFIARIYFILFKKECPRLSRTAKKMIAKVGHWYLDECATYIRVFGATEHHISYQLMSQTDSSWEKFLSYHPAGL
jgi:hypothetical protein